MTSDSGPGTSGADAILQRVFHAWRLSADLHDLGSPATDATIAEAERVAGRPLPDRLKAVCRFGDGLSLLGGNLGIEPLLGTGDDGLVAMSERLRSWSWPIPPEVLMIGDNGGDELFGLWYPQGAPANDPTPVVIVGSVFEPACLALMGTDLPEFLLAWSGFYLAMLEAPERALDALGVPLELRTPESTTDLVPFVRWGDPSLPDADPNPYERGLDVAGVRRLVEALAR